MPISAHEGASASLNNGPDILKGYLTYFNKLSRNEPTGGRILVPNNSYSNSNTGIMLPRVDSALLHISPIDPQTYSPCCSRPAKHSFQLWAPTQPNIRSKTVLQSGYISSLPAAAASNIANVLEKSISQNYRGNLLSLRNQSADIPADLNTSVWITNLPPHCTYYDLLSVIRDTGKVYATVLNPASGEHTTSAAKIVFFDVEGRKRLQRRACAGAFAVGAYLPAVVPNRVRTAAQQQQHQKNPAGPQSRVLLITGPTAIVNEAFLCPLFQCFCAFDIEYVRDYPHGDGIDGTTTMEWAFGSFRCQAERVYAAMLRFAETVAAGCVWVEYGRDPCDREE
ncbi:hypothetical protein F5B17DRAFT_454277 [Nemania serpens]|nr:hypothetical protein F5B17DRAFT_454277 [Nemania serpens]